MTIKTLAAVGAALILVASNAHAKTSTIREFDRHTGGYVSQTENIVVAKHTKHKRRYQERPAIPRNYAAGSLVEKAKAYIGTNPTGWGSLWCGRFMGMIAPAAAERVSNPNMARAYLELPATTPQVGAIAVLSRGRKGGHVGVVSGFDDEGNPIIISGNHGRRVGEGVYPKSRVIAYVSGG